MATKVLEMPRLGESVTEGEVEKWLKSEGEMVEQDEPLVEVATDKVTAEIPSPFAGTVVRILVPEGATIQVGQALAHIEIEDGRPEGAPTVQAEARDDGAASAEHSDEAGGPAIDGRSLISPPVRKLAADHGVDLAAIAGTGAGGRVTRRDVLAVVELPLPDEPPLPAEEVIPLTPVRRQAAAHLTKSASTIPHAWTMREADVTRLVRFRREHKDDFLNQHGVPLTLLPLLIEVVCQSLRANPLLNSTWTDDAIILKRDINLGIAMATEESVLVPVIKAADTLSRQDLAATVNDLTTRAREQRLTVADMQGGTFTLNNTGALGLGGVMGMAIINYPQAAILNTESIRRRPMVIGEDAIAIRDVMNLTLSFDHRIIDGVHAGRFLHSVQEKLEKWEA